MPALDITGQRFGELVAVARVSGIGLAARGAMWLCRCDCGAESIREGVVLRYSRKRGIRSMCAECLGEFRRGGGIAVRERHQIILRELWERHRSLWSPLSEERLVALILADLERAHGPRAESLPVLTDLHIDPAWPYSPGNRRRIVRLENRDRRSEERRAEMRRRRRDLIREAQRHLGLPTAASGAPDVEGLVPLGDREAFTTSMRARAKGAGR